MAEFAGVLGFAAEALDHEGLGGQLRREHLEGDIALGFGVVGLVDGPHAAGGEVGRHAIFADLDGAVRPLGGRVQGHDDSRAVGIR